MGWAVAEPIGPVVAVVWAMDCCVGGGDGGGEGDGAGESGPPNRDVDGGGCVIGEGDLWGPGETGSGAR